MDAGEAEATVAKLEPTGHSKRTSFWLLYLILSPSLAPITMARIRSDPLCLQEPRSLHVFASIFGSKKSN